MFATYFPIGYEHIVGIAGIDHLLFMVVLCASYTRREWRKVLLLLTGFTLGHSLTLALTALHLVSIPAKWVEVLIPLTILATSIANVLPNKNAGPGNSRRFLPLFDHQWPFVMATVFGLVHGCGFAGYFAMMLGDESNILGPLLAFNLGLEAGQIATVTVYFLFVLLVEQLCTIEQRNWSLFVSGAGTGLALKMILDNLLAL